VLQGGNELCRIEGFDRGKAVSELKVSIEAKTGLVPALTRLTNSESHTELQDHLTLEDAGMPSEQALAEGVIQLYVQKLKKVVVAEELQIAPGEVTDSKLTVLCDSIRDNPPDILVLCGCRRVTNISCLVQLSTISHLDISGCSLGATGGFHLAGVIKDMGALTSLDMSDNVLGCEEAGQALGDMLATNSTLQQLNLSNNFITSGSATKFAQALSIGLRDNRALLFLDISDNNIGTSWNLNPAYETNPDEEYKYKSTDGGGQDEEPAGELGPIGVIAVANAIKDMAALTSLNFSSNYLQAEGAKVLAEAIKVTNCRQHFHAHLFMPTAIHRI
jgi:hypothetical protein